MSEALKNLEQKIPNQEIAQVDDTNTWLAEVLDGQMRSEFTYHFNGEDLIARDGRPLGPIFEDAIVDAEAKAMWNPDLAFELRRRQLEMEEYIDMLAMAEGGAPNTMVVVSDFPPELMTRDKDMCGYNVTRRQTMLRVITRNEDGSITAASQSLDGSHRSGLEAIYDFMGAPVQRGELLGQRIHIEIEPEFQNKLADSLMRVYDHELEIKFGQEFFAGRRSEDRRNTMDFALHQEDLIDAYLVGPQDNNAKFKLAAAISARFESRSETNLQLNTYQLASGSCLSPIVEMELQGRIAAREGRTFSGCGGSISMEDGPEAELKQLGYGDKDKKSDDDGTMRCVNCPECKTYHHEVRKVRGKPVCDNEKCKLSDRKK